MSGLSVRHVNPSEQTAKQLKHTSKCQPNKLPKNDNLLDKWSFVSESLDYPALPIISELLDGLTLRPVVFCILICPDAA